MTWVASVVAPVPVPQPADDGNERAQLACHLKVASEQAVDGAVGADHEDGHRDQDRERDPGVVEHVLGQALGFVNARLNLASA